jgi:hypothetical protein
MITGASIYTGPPYLGSDCTMTVTTGARGMERLVVAIIVIVCRTAIGRMCSVARPGTSKGAVIVDAASLDSIGVHVIDVIIINIITDVDVAHPLDGTHGNGNGRWLWMWMWMWRHDTLLLSTY